MRSHAARSLLLIALGACGAGGGAKPDGSGGATGVAGASGTGGRDAAETSDAPRDASAGAAGGDAEAPRPDASDTAAGVDGLAPDGQASDGDGSEDTSVPEAATSCAPCVDYGAVTQVGRVTAAALDQLSGIATSRRNPGVLFVHNDHSATEFWAVSEAGVLLATFTYTGVTVRDVEDVAVGPCPSGTCVFLADIGGNLAARPDYTIVRLPEPAVGATPVAAPLAVAAEKLVFTYPDGAQHNAESLLIDPRAGTPYIIDKVAAGLPSTAYRLSATFGAAPIVATKVGELPVPGPGDLPATAADAHPCGTGFVLATGNTAYEFRIAPGAPFEDAFKAAPVVVPVAQEQQREGIAYQPDGRGFFTNSEGAMQPIHHTGCK